MCARILRAKGDSNSPYTTLSGELKKTITKRISMIVDECNNRWKLLIRNASRASVNPWQYWSLVLRSTSYKNINVEQNWN